MLLLETWQRGTFNSQIASQSQYSRRPPWTERQEALAPDMGMLEGKRQSQQGAPSKEGGTPGREVSGKPREQRVLGRRASSGH